MGNSNNETFDGTNGPIAVWANSSSYPVETTLDVSGSDQTVDGTMVSRGHLKIGGSNNDFLHGTEYGLRTANDQALDISGSGNCFTGNDAIAQVARAAPAQPSGFPVEFNPADYAPGSAKANAAHALGQYYACPHVPGQSSAVPSPASCSGVNITVPGGSAMVAGLYYATGDITVSGGSITGNVTLVALGKISIAGSNQVFTSYVDGLLFLSNFGTPNSTASGEDALKAEGSTSSYSGHIVARNGRLVMAGSNSFYDCAVMGDRVTLNGQNLYIAGGLCSSPPPQTFDLTVNKTIGANSEPFPGASTFTIVVDCDNNTFDTTFTFDNTGALVPPPATNVIANIPSGVVCDVTETNDGNPEPDECTVTTTVNGSPGNTTEVTMSENRTVTFENSLACTYDLTVNKTIGAGTEPFPEASTFTIVVDCDNDTFDTTFTFDNTGALVPPPPTNVIENIPSGVICDVTETDDGNPDPDDCTVTTTVNGSPGNTTEVTMSENRTVTFENSLACTYDLTVNKTIGANSEPFPGTSTFTIVVDCDNDTFDTTFTFDNTGALVPPPATNVIDDIPSGVICDVTETGDGNPDPDNCTVTTTVNGSPGNTTEVTMSENRTVTFENSLACTYDLTVNKTIAAGSDPFPGTSTFTIVVDCDNNTFDTTFTFDNTGALVPPPATNVIADIPSGVSCVVYETNNGDPDRGDDCNVTTLVNGQSSTVEIDETEFPGTNVTLDENRTVTFENSLNCSYDLTVTKTIAAGSEPFPGASTFTIEVDCDDNTFDTTFTFDNTGALVPPPATNTPSGRPPRRRR